MSYLIVLTGEIGLMTWKEVKQLDASSKYTGIGSYRNERVPHLRDMLKECKTHGKTCSVWALIVIVVSASQQVPE